MKLIITCICLIGVKNITFAIDSKEILKKMTQVYEQTQVYELHNRYELFKGHKSDLVVESYEGYLCKDKSNAYQKIDQTEMVMTSSFCLQISHAEKKMVLMKGQAFHNNEVDFEKAIKECKEIKSEEQGKYYMITLLIKNTSQLPFSVVKVKIRKSDYHIIQLDLYYAETQDFSKNPNKTDLDKPHMRVSYTKFDKKMNVDKSRFAFETYFKTINTMIKPIGSIAQYELIDNRII